MKVSRKMDNELMLKREAFSDFGKDGIKRNLKIHPDAFVQIALQLAHYKLHGFAGEFN